MLRAVVLHARLITVGVRVVHESSQVLGAPSPQPSIVFRFFTVRKFS